MEPIHVFLNTFVNNRKHSTKRLVAGYAIMRTYVDIAAQHHYLSLQGSHRHASGDVPIAGNKKSQVGISSVQCSWRCDILWLYKRVHTRTRPPRQSLFNIRSKFKETLNKSEAKQFVASL